VEEEDDEDGCHCTEWQIDVETPSPCQFVRENTTKEWSGDTGYTVHGTDESCESRSLAQRHGAGDDKNSSGEDASSSDSSNSPTNDQGCRVGCNSTDQRTKLEDAKSDEIDPFQTVEGVQFTGEQLEGASSQKITASNPAYIVDGLELIGDL